MILTQTYRELGCPQGYDLMGAFMMHVEEKTGPGGHGTVDGYNAAIRACHEHLNKVCNFNWVLVGAKLTPASSRSHESYHVKALWITGDVYRIHIGGHEVIKDEHWY